MHVHTNKRTYQLGFEKLEKGAPKNSISLEILEYCNMTWRHRHSKLWVCSKGVRWEKDSFSKLSYIYLCTYLLHLCVHVCVCAQACHSAHVWKSREQVQKSVPIYYAVGCRDQNWIIKLMANIFNRWAMSVAWEEVWKDKIWEDCIQYLKMRIVFTMIHSKLWHKPRVEQIVAGQMSW